MTVLEFVERRGIKKIQLAKDIGVDASRLSKHLHAWQALPKKHLPQLAKALGLSLAEIESNRVRESRLRADG